MNILLIDHYAGSPERGMEFRPYYLAREWQRLGHRVLVIAADFSHLRRVNFTVARSFSRVDVEGVPYLVLKTPRYAGNGLSRGLNIASFCLQLLRRAGRLAREFEPDAVIASSTYPFDFYAARRIVRRAGGRCFFEIHDLWPLTQIELYGMSVTNPYVRLLQRAEDFAFAHADGVLSVLPDAYKHMEERGFSAAKFTCVPNGVVPDAPVSPARHAPLLEKLRAEGAFVVLYVGGFARANALEPLVRAAARTGEGVRIVLVGDGPERPALQRLGEQVGAGRLLFLDAVPKAEVQPLLALADCLYIGALRCSLYRYGMGMNKLYDYMLAARPILCGVEAANDPVKEAGCGLTIPPQDAQAIADGVARLRTLPAEERAHMGQNGRAYVLAYHDYRVLAERFLQALAPGGADV